MLLQPQSVPLVESQILDEHIDAVWPQCLTEGFLCKCCNKKSPFYHLGYFQLSQPWWQWRWFFCSWAPDPDPHRPAQWSVPNGIVGTVCCACPGTEYPRLLGEPLTETLGRACLPAALVEAEARRDWVIAFSHTITSNGARVKVLNPQHPRPGPSSAPPSPMPLHRTLSSFLEQMSSCSEESIYFRYYCRHSVNMGCECFSHEVVMFGLFPQLFLCMPPNVVASLDIPWIHFHSNK